MIFKSVATHVDSAVNLRGNRSQKQKYGITLQVKSFISCACRQDIMMPLILQVQLPNLSFWIQETFQVCCLTIGFVKTH